MAFNTQEFVRRFSGRAKTWRALPLALISGGGEQKLQPLICSSLSGAIGKKKVLLQEVRFGRKCGPADIYILPAKYEIPFAPTDVIECKFNYATQGTEIRRRVNDGIDQTGNYVRSFIEGKRARIPQGWLLYSVFDCWISSKDERLQFGCVHRFKHQKRRNPSDRALATISGLQEKIEDPMEERKHDAKIVRWATVEEREVRLPLEDGTHERMRFAGVLALIKVMTNEQ